MAGKLKPTTLVAGTVPLCKKELIAMQRAQAMNMADEMPWVGKRKGGRSFGSELKDRGLKCSH